MRHQFQDLELNPHRGLLDALGLLVKDLQHKGVEARLEVPGFADLEVVPQYDGQQDLRLGGLDLLGRQVVANKTNEN